MATLEKIKEESKKVRQEVREKTLGYIIGGFGLVAGLAWNDAIKSSIEYLFPSGKSSLSLKFVYAFGVTVFIVIITVYLLKLVSPKKDE